MKDAMRAKDAKRLGTIRMLTAAMKQKEVDERIELDDRQILAIIEKMIKQRKDSISQFEAGGRPDLADNERAEVDVLSAYMPEALPIEGNRKGSGRSGQKCRGSPGYGQGNGRTEIASGRPCRYVRCFRSGQKGPDEGLNCRLIREKVSRMKKGFFNS